MLRQSWISPPANHYTLHIVLQCCPPAVKSPWHVFFKQLSYFSFLGTYHPALRLLMNTPSLLSAFTSMFSLYFHSPFPVLLLRLTHTPGTAALQLVPATAGAIREWFLCSLELSPCSLWYPCTTFEGLITLQNTNESSDNPQPEEEATNHTVQMGKLQQS